MTSSETGFYRLKQHQKRGGDGLLPNSKYGQKWSEDETILAFYYYCKIPFGKIHSRNPEIVRVAELLGRTPGSVSFKMGNLGHFDPELQKRKVSGLKNASKLDEKVVLEFLGDWEGLSYKAVMIEEQLKRVKMYDAAIRDMSIPIGSEVERVARQRVNQDFFREAVLSAYGDRCCISGISIPSLLVASHIKPWAKSDPKTERTNPANGLSLNALHDKAFDRGLITVTPDYIIHVSSKLKTSPGDDGLAWLRACDKQKIILPEKFVPQREFLEYHNDMIFVP